MSLGVVDKGEDKKPAVVQGTHINLKVKGLDGNKVFFRIKRSTELKTLMNAYCDRMSVDFNSIAFSFDGGRLRAEQTPDELEMEDGDIIHAFIDNQGAGIELKVKGQDTDIKLKVQGQDGKEFSSRIKRSTPLKKLMDGYCVRQSAEVDSIAFRFEGIRLRAEQTPDELKMEDGDDIDAMVHMTGGSAI